MPSTRIVEKVSYRRGPIGWLFKVAFILFNVLMLVWMVSYCARVAPDLQTGSQASQTGAAVGVGLGITMIMVIWVAGAVILGLFTLFTRGTRIVERTTPDA